MGVVDFNIGDAFSKLIGLGSEFIEDKDLRNKFNMQIMEFKNDFNTALVTQKTHPTVDALVKLLFALNSLWRPAVGAAMTAFGIYAHLKGLDISATSQVIFDGAFPAWGVSRHVEKGKK